VALGQKVHGILLLEQLSSWSVKTLVQGITVDAALTAPTLSINAWHGDGTGEIQLAPLFDSSPSQAVRWATCCAES